MRVLCLLGALILACTSGLAQTDWPMYGHDFRGTRYSPDSQINAKNVSQLHVAWTYDTGEKGEFLETTPIVVKGTMYFTTPNERVVAVDPDTGKEIWSYDPQVKRAFHQRGVGYWPGDQQHKPRIVLTTTDGRMMELDAATGKLIPEFGDNGVLDLAAGLVTPDLPHPRVTFSSAPTVYKNLVIVGPETQEGPSQGPSGDPRAFDVLTGKLVWRFHTVPRPGEPGNETWGPDGWKGRSGPSLWGMMTIDERTGTIFMPVGNPADNFYGADRKGTNLYSCSVIALNAMTGKLIWAYQTSHHDIWDYDDAAAPALIEVKKDGKQIPAVVEMAKTGLMFILDRRTGKPIFGVEERPVPKSDVPGEEAWPTQPFPVEPPPLARTSITASELSTITPKSAAFCKALFAQAHNDGPFTPYGTEKTVVFPGTVGGGNWNGISFDPKLGYIFTNTSDIGALGQMVKSQPGAAGPGGSPAMPYRNATAYARFVDQDHYPCNQPPWGHLIAIDANTGQVVWKTVLGNYDELSAQGIQDAGTPNLGGTIATAGGLIFVGATNDGHFRAFDAKTGKELWSVIVGGDALALPLTYMGSDKKQYVVVGVGGAGFLQTFGKNPSTPVSKIVAFALP